jgi:hypothetical protein
VIRRSGSIIRPSHVFRLPMKLSRAVCSAVVSRSLVLLLAVVAAAAGAVAGATAAAGQSLPPGAGGPGTLGVSVKGSTVVRLDSVLFASVRSSGAKVRAGKPATPTKTGVKFRVSSVAVGTDGESYLLRHKGSMRVSTRTRSVTLKSPTASVSGATGQGAMTAVVGTKRVRVATLQIDIGRLEQTGTGIDADNVNLAMTARLATELNRVLGTNTLTEGTTLGKATVRVVTES